MSKKSDFGSSFAKIMRESSDDQIIKKAEALQWCRNTGPE